MKAVRNHSALAQQATSRGQGVDAPSPEQSESGVSGTYFRAVRPTPAEADAVARGELVIDCTKVERLQSLVLAGMWRVDAELVARRMLEDAG